ATGISAVRQRRNPAAAGLCRGYWRSDRQHNAVAGDGADLRAGPAAGLRLSLAAARAWRKSRQGAAVAAGALCVMEDHRNHRRIAAGPADHAKPGGVDGVRQHRLARRARLCQPADGASIAGGNTSPDQPWSWGRTWSRRRRSLDGVNGSMMLY